MADDKLCLQGGQDHCWGNKGSMSYNNTDGTVVDVETEECRHCPAKRERKTVMKITYTPVEDSGWKQK